MKPISTSAHLWHIIPHRKWMRIMDLTKIAEIGIHAIHQSYCFLYVRRAVYTGYLKYEQFRLWQKQNKTNKRLTINHAHRRSDLYSFTSHSLNHGRMEIYPKSSES